MEVNDISLEDYIAVKPKFARFTTHSAGRFQARRFRKAQCPIVERCGDAGMGSAGAAPLVSVLVLVLARWCGCYRIDKGQV